MWSRRSSGGTTRLARQICEFPLGGCIFAGQLIELASCTPGQIAAAFCFMSMALLAGSLRTLSQGSGLGHRAIWCNSGNLVEGFGSVNGVDKAALELQSAAVVTWVVARFTTTFYLSQLASNTALVGVVATPLGHSNGGCCCRSRRSAGGVRSGGGS